jgi:hypothetical protein
MGGSNARYASPDKQDDVSFCFATGVLSASFPYGKRGFTTENIASIDKLPKKIVLSILTKECCRVSSWAK